MLRNVARQLSGRSEPSLPGSYNSSPGGGFFFASRKDGSAKSIQTAPTLREAWRRMSLERKITIIASITSAIMILWGWRLIRYSSAGITLNCQSHSCEILLRPVGWAKPARVLDVSKYQLQLPKAIMVRKNGDFLTDQDVSLTERNTTPTGNQSKQKAKYQKRKDATYKGPDEYGRYTTYAIILTDKRDTVFPDDVELPENHQAADLANIRHLIDEFKDESDNGKTKYRIIPTKFGVQHSKRRVRTMMQKIESYIRRRRMKAIVKEDAPPSWQGVLLMVFGFTGVLLTLILGQFTMPTTAEAVAATHQSGPGVRRQRDPFRSATPSKYEVSTKPNLSVYRNSTTTTRKRS